MEAKRAVDVLTQVAVAAQKGGLLTLEEAPIVLEAVQFLNGLVSPKEDVKPPTPTLDVVG